MTRLALAASCLLLLTACTSEQEQFRQDAVQPHLNVLARQMVQELDVVCAVGLLPDGGTGRSSSTDLAFVLTVDDLDDPELPALLRRAGQLVWDSPLRISTLDVDSNGPDLSEELRGPGASSLPLTSDELVEAFGERSERLSVPPEIDDPGRPDC